MADSVTRDDAVMLPLNHGCTATADRMKARGLESAPPKREKAAPSESPELEKKAVTKSQALALALALALAWMAAARTPLENVVAQKMEAQDTMPAAMFFFSRN